jgi:hypothetical protein
MPITALPTPPTRQDPTNFSSRADTFLAALPAFATEANTTASEVNSNAVAAAASAAAAAVSYDSFDDRYLGSKASNPTLDNDSQTLLVGAMYWNSTSNEMRVWNGSAWVAVQTTSAATSAAASAAAAEASYDSFDDRYLGAKASAPTLDNDGASILTGALYWNTTTSRLFLWNGSSWIEAAFSSAGVTTFNTRNGAVTLTLADIQNASYTFTSSSTVNTAVLRDGSGNFSANIITVLDLNSTSDQNLKENINTLKDSIDTINKINPVEFTWKDSKAKSYGVIAQEIQQILPELVQKNESNTLGVNYIPIIALLLDAVQQLDKRVKYLENK